MAERRPTALAFLPTSVPGCKLWLKADGTRWQEAARTTPALLDGDPVGAWDDGSLSVNHALQATAAKRPSLRLAVRGALPALRFDGVDDILSTATVPQTTAAYTLFLVGQGAAGAGNRTLAYCGTTANGYGFYTVAANRGIIHNGVNILTDGAATVLWELWSAVRTAAPLVSFFVNGGSVAVTNGTAAANLPTTRFEVGGLTSSAFSACDVGEVILYDNALQAADRQAVEAYLMTRWSLP